MSQSLITDHCLIFLSSSVPQWTQLISPGWTKCSFKSFILPALSPSILFLTNCIYHCSNMTRYWGVWGCSERRNGSFQSIIAFPWKSQLDPSALLCISQSSPAPPLQTGFFVFFFPIVPFNPDLSPFSQIQTLSCLFILSPPFCLFAGSPSQTLVSTSLCPSHCPIGASCFRCFSSSSSWLHVIQAGLIQPTCSPSEVLHSAIQQ